MKQQYFKLSRKYHPDFVGNGTDEEKEEALQMSSLVNKGYKIFNNQDDTIKYVLLSKGMLQEEEKYVLPNNFLMEVMDLNEQLMDAKMEDDNNKIEKIKQVISEIQYSIFNIVNHILNAETIDNIDESGLLKVKDYYFKKKYLNRILDSIV